MQARNNLAKQRRTDKTNEISIFYPKTFKKPKSEPAEPTATAQNRRNKPQFEKFKNEHDKPKQIKITKTPKTKPNPNKQTQDKMCRNCDRTEPVRDWQWSRP